MKDYDKIYKIIVLIENVINFINNNKHIIAYNKLLGIQQNIYNLDNLNKKEDKTFLILKIHIILNLMRDGKYVDSMKNIKEIKSFLCKELNNNERNKN